MLSMEFRNLKLVISFRSDARRRRAITALEDGLAHVVLTARRCGNGVAVGAWVGSNDAVAAVLRRRRTVEQGVSK